jgi:serine/threonine-protein kinase PknG
VASGDRAGALAAYERVPESASAHDEAQTARVRCLLDGVPGLAELRAAGVAIDSLSVSAERRAMLTAQLQRAAIELVGRARDVQDPDVTLGGRALVETQLRLGLERTYRSLAAVAPTPSERRRLVDEANRVRPRTWT